MASYAIAIVVSDGSGLRLGFFEAAAGIIPVLLLALAVEGRVLSPAAGRPYATDLLGSAFLLLVFMLGEWVALEAIGSGEASSGEGEVVIAALAAGFVGIGLTALTSGVRVAESLGGAP